MQRHLVGDRHSRERGISIKTNDARDLPRQLVAIGDSELLEVLAILNTQHLGLRVIQNVGNVLRRGVRIETRGLAPDQEEGQVHVNPFGTVVRQDGPYMTRREPVRVKIKRHGTHTLPILLCSVSHPLVILLNALRNGFRCFFGPGFKTVQKCSRHVLDLPTPRRNVNRPGEDLSIAPAVPFRPNARAGD